MNKTEHDGSIGGIGAPRTFRLERTEDKTGVSGNGLVAEGCVFSDGTTVIRWRTQYRSTTVYASAREAQAIHGHGGATLIKYDGYEGALALACSNCAHAMGDHVADNAAICIAGGCSCCLMEHPEFHAVAGPETQRSQAA
jgi:hypothetical protein